MPRQKNNQFTRSASLALISLITFILLSYLFVGHDKINQSAAAQSPVPKYIFIFLVDGGGTTHLEITRQYNRYVHNEGTIITDKIMKEGSMGLLTTHAADALTTDSAAAATALACGCKASIGILGVCANGDQPKTVMEVAKSLGLRIGLVTNSTIYDASPAAFATHVAGRLLYADIIDQYLRFEPDLLMGGGRDLFLPVTQPGSRRRDDQDIIALFRQKGYSYVANKQELMAANGPRVLGLFSFEEMSFEIDRDKNAEPSIYDMTEAAIRILQAKNSRGFALFIENEHIDSAAHFTDVATLVRDFREFDRSVGLAYEFYKKHPSETLILVTSDHETGGLGLVQGLKDLKSTRGPNRLTATDQELKKIHSIPISLKKAAEILGPKPSAEAVDRLLADYFKGFTLAPDFKETILNGQPLSRSIYSDPTRNTLGMMVANHTQAYFLTTAHTNHPVFVAALGPGAENFRGYLDNTDFGKRLKAIIDGNKSR